MNTAPDDELGSLSPKLLVLFDEVRKRFEAALQHGKPEHIEDILVAVDDKIRSRLLCELLTIEIDWRQRRGEIPRSEEYQSRFPRDTELIERAFQTSIMKDDSDSTQPVATLDSAATADFSPPGSSSQAETEHDTSPHPDADQVIEVGTHVSYFGDYELIKELGRGGMGIVYQARQVSLNRLVALKMLKSDVLASDDELRRFQNEAEAVARLDHPNVVPILEVGDHAGRRYFTMKLIAGVSLEKRLADFKANPKSAARLMATAAEAVHHAHQRGILHRDLKPANILLDEHDQPHVSDFGLAKRIEGDSELTQTGAVMGTPAYMAPEQASGRRGAVTTASDVYGLGAVLYALLTGRAPFRGSSIMEILDEVRESTPVSPSKHNPKVARDLEVICLKCLEKDPTRRYNSTQALADDLHRHLAGEPIEARPSSRWERTWLWCKRNPRLAASLSATAAALVAVAVLSLLYARREANANRFIRVLQTSREQLTKELRLRLAKFEFERGRTLFEKGETGQGLVRLAVSYAYANEAEDPGWKHTTLSNIAAWQRLLPRVKSEFSWRPFSWRTGGAISPDGKIVATTGGYRLEYTLLWDVASGQQIGKLMHGAIVNSAAFGPDSRTVITAGDDKTVRLWDAATSKPIGQPLLNQQSFPFEPFSPDCKNIITFTHDKTVRLWDAATSKPIGQSMTHQDRIMFVKFSSDGKSLMTGSADNTARRWDAATARPIGPELRHEGKVIYSELSPNGKTLMRATSEAVLLWDFEVNKQIGKPIRYSGNLTGVEFTPDGEKILLASENTAQLWDAITTKPIGKPMKHNDQFTGGMFSPDGKTLMTIHLGKTAHLWDATTGQSFGKPMIHQDDIISFAFSSDSRTLITGSRDKTAQLWDADTGLPIGFPVKHPGLVSNVGFSPEGTTARSTSNEKTILWKVARNDSIGQLLSQGDGISSAKFSPDGTTLLTISSNGISRLWNAGTRRLTAGPLGHLDGVTNLAFSPDGRTVITVGSGGTWRLWKTSSFYTKDEIDIPENGDRTARLWNVITGQPIGLPMTHEDKILSVAFSPDGKTVLTASMDKTARLWHSRTGRPIGRPMKHTDSVVSIAYSPDGKTVLTGSTDKTVRLWDANDGHPMGEPMQHQEAIKLLAFSPDGKTVAVASETDKVQLWNPNTCLPIGQAITGDENFGVQTVRFSPNSKGVILECTDGNVRRFDSTTGLVSTDEPIDRTTVHAIAYSHDGKLKLTGGDDGFARIVSLDRWRPYGGQVMKHKEPVLSVAFSPDGKTVLTGSADKTAQFWDANTGLPIGPSLIHQDTVDFVVFSPTGHTVVTVSGSGARLWPVEEFIGNPSPDLVRHWVVQLTGLDLDSDEEISEVSRNSSGSQYALAKLNELSEVVEPGHFDPILFGSDPTARAKAWVQRGRFSEAEAAFDEAVKERPYEASVFYDKSRFELSQNRTDAAYADLGRAMALGVRSRETDFVQRLHSDGFLSTNATGSLDDESLYWTIRGEFRAKQGKWETAAEDFVEVVTNCPRNLFNRKHLILSLAFAGEREKLKQARTDLLDEFAETTLAWEANQVAWLSALVPDADERLDQIVRLAEQAVKVKSTASSLHTLGAALYRAGRYEEALRRFEECIKKHYGITFPLDWPFLAMVHHRLGHHDEARRWLAHFRKPQPITPEKFSWEDLEIRLLRSEAEAVVLWDPIFPADPFIH